MHHGAGEGGDCAGAERQVPIRHLRGASAVGVDHDQPGAAGFAGTGDMGHHIDLRRHRIAAPDDDQIGFRHLPRIGPPEDAGAGKPAGGGDGGADRIQLARIAECMAEAPDAAALHQAHGAGEIIGPDALAAMAGGERGKAAGHAVQRLVPADAAELAAALGPGAQQRMQQTLRVMDPLGIAGDLRADHPGGIRVRRRAADGADPAALQHLHLQGAGRRTIMRAGRGAYCHRASLSPWRAVGNMVPVKAYALKPPGPS